MDLPFDFLLTDELQRCDMASKDALSFCLRKAMIAIITKAILYTGRHTARTIIKETDVKLAIILYLRMLEHNIETGCWMEKESYMLSLDDDESTTSYSPPSEELEEPEEVQITTTEPSTGLDVVQNPNTEFPAGADTENLTETPAMNGDTNDNLDDDSVSSTNNSSIYSDDSSGNESDPVVTVDESGHLIDPWGSQLEGKFDDSTSDPPQQSASYDSEQDEDYPHPDEVATEPRWLFNLNYDAVRERVWTACAAHLDELAMYFTDLVACLKAELLFSIPPGEAFHPDLLFDNVTVFLPLINFLIWNATLAIRGDRRR